MSSSGDAVAVGQVWQRNLDGFAVCVAAARLDAVDEWEFDVPGLTLSGYDLRLDYHLDRRDPAAAA